MTTPDPQHEFSRVEEAIDRIRSGGTVIVVDDEDRENEGDFISAAESVTPEMIHFMVRRGGGVLCVPLRPERARALDLQPATERNSALHRTAFTESVDLRSATTGVSAAERAETVRALARDGARPQEFARPGHVFPIIAQEGGVLRRAGHTEAAVDLAELAGLKPVGVLIEILDDDGRMARRARLHEIAREHDMPIITIADLIRYRSRRTQLVERVASADLPTKLGSFRIYAYKVKYEAQEPLVLAMGDLASAKAPLVRMHSSCFTGDVLESLRCDCGDQLRIALEMIASDGVGAVVYLPQEGRGIGLSEKVKAYALQDDGHDTVEANILLGYRADMRDYGVGIQILKDLGLSDIRLLTNNPKKVDSSIYEGYELSVVDQVPLVAPPRPERARYLQAKRDKLGHRLPPESVDLAGEDEAY